MPTTTSSLLPKESVAWKKTYESHHILENVNYPKQMITNVRIAYLKFKLFLWIPSVSFLHHPPSFSSPQLPPTYLKPQNGAFFHAVCTKLIPTAAHISLQGCDCGTFSRKNHWKKWSVPKTDLSQWQISKKIGQPGIYSLSRNHSPWIYLFPFRFFSAPPGYNLPRAHAHG